MERKLTDVPKPAALVFLQESQILISYNALRPGDFSSYGYCPGQYTFWRYNDGIQETYSATHAHGGNLIFCDGHVEYRKLNLIRSGDFGLLPGTDTPNVTNANDKCYSPAF